MKDADRGWENGREEKEYLIGDVSRIVGMSRDALRFYEKKGVIRSQKKENGYRYFSSVEMTFTG